MDFTSLLVMLSCFAFSSIVLIEPCVGYYYQKKEKNRLKSFLLYYLLFFYVFC